MSVQLTTREIHRVQFYVLELDKALEKLLRGEEGAWQEYRLVAKKLKRAL